MSSNTLEDIEDMPPVEAMMQAKYLSASDLEGDAETVTILRIRRGKETFEAGRKDEVNVITVARANGDTAEMIWCKTNVAAARVLLGDDNTKWIGKRVTLCADEDRNRGEVVVAIRICGSPDAPPGRAKAFQAAWDHPDGRMNGRKGKGSLITRLKVIIARTKAKAAAGKPAAESKAEAPKAEQSDATPPVREPGQEG